jgi:hypothetical protein
MVCLAPVTRTGPAGHRGSVANTSISGLGAAALPLLLAGQKLGTGYWLRGAAAGGTCLRERRGAAGGAARGAAAEQLELVLVQLKLPWRPCAASGIERPDHPW